MRFSEMSARDCGDRNENDGARDVQIVISVNTAPVVGMASKPITSPTISGIGISDGSFV